MGFSAALYAGVGITGAIAFAAPDQGFTPLALETAPQRILAHDMTNISGDRCIDCHAFDPIFSHPIGVTPPASMTVPTSLPLTDGKVTCLTCHAGSQSDHDPDRKIDRIHLEPKVPGPDLCLQCHDRNGSSAEEMHASSLGQAHLMQSGNENSASAPSPWHLAEWVDAESDSCMSCHDGAIASGSGTHAEMIPGMGLFDSMGSEHPIGEYRLTNPGDADGPLKAATMLDERIRLFDNHVGCGSCHSVYSPVPDLLVMSNAGSQLCLSCHEY